MFVVSFYLYFRRMGTGAFGAVYHGFLSTDLSDELKRGLPIAIKTLHESHSDSYIAESEFAVEAQIMAKFEHR